MKKILIPLLLLCITLGYAQEKKITIDYIVDYVIEDKDTITIGFSKDGNYLWTNQKDLAKDFAKSMIKNRALIDKAKANIFFDTQKGDIILLFSIDENIIYFNINLNILIPDSEVSVLEENLNIITEKTDEKIVLFNNDYYYYKMYPENDPKDVIFLSTNEDYPINNNRIIKRFFELVIQMSTSSGNINVDFPNGIIQQIKEKDKILLQALKINTRKKVFTLTHSFKISE